MTRLRAALAAAILAAALLAGAGSASPDSDGIASTATIDGLDLHDSTAYEADGTFYLVGSMYGCGFQWQQPSPWCGFGVSTAPTLTGPWTKPTLLFPVNELDPLTHKTFASECALTNGAGCFNPRMVQRSSDGVWLMWFNEVNGRQSTTTNAYWLVGCNGPAGPCAASAGAPHGSTHKPVLHQCNGNNGDFGLVPDPTTGGAALICSYGGVLSAERLDASWANGTGVGSSSLAGLTHVEGPGAWWDPVLQTWLMTFSDVNCGYCSGTGTGYATAPSVTGPWTTPDNVGWSAPTNGRRLVSGTSCGGQPRTVAMVDSVPYQVIDTWTGTRNEATADTVLAPLSVTLTTGSTGDGHPWIPPVSYAC